MNKQDMFFMRETIKLAKKGEGFTTPNPLVGCIIVKNGKIISRGYHKRAGDLHAEAIALKKAGRKAKGATLYVNLEPCVHFGKTPPCADAIIKSKIKRVVISMRDPNPLVNGKGVRKLKKAGIEVVENILNAEAKELNKIFIKNMLEKKIYVILKMAQSLDGKIALKNGKSKWITEKIARLDVQKLRKKVDGILVGINTILNDNPFLDCRINKNKKLKKIVFDSKLRTPLNANIFKYSNPDDVYIFTTTENYKRVNYYVKNKINIIKLNKDKKINEEKALNILWNKGIRSLLVEGGSKIATSFIRNKLVDELYLYIAPIIIGGDGKSVYEDLGFEDLKEVIKLKKVFLKTLNKTILLRGEQIYV